MRTINVALATLALLFLLTIIKPHEAARILDEEGQEMMKGESLLLQTLQRGPVTPSTPAPGTYIPASTLGEQGFAGRTMLLPNLQRGPVTPSTPAPGTYIPASRPSTLGEQGFAGQTMLLPNLQRGPVTPTPDPGTYIPAPQTYIPTNTLGEQGFAGRAMPLPPPPVYSKHTVQFGVATN